MWFSLKIYDAVCHLTNTPTCNQLQSHHSRGSTKQEVFFFIIINPWGAQVLYIKKSFPEGADFSPLDLFRLIQMTTFKCLSRYVFLADGSIPSPDHKRSCVSCMDQKKKATPRSKPPCRVALPQICPIGLWGVFFIYLFFYFLMAFKNNKEFDMTAKKNVKLL